MSTRVTRAMPQSSLSCVAHARKKKPPEGNHDASSLADRHPNDSVCCDDHRVDRDWRSLAEGPGPRARWILACEQPGRAGVGAEDPGRPPAREHQGEHDGACGRTAPSRLREAATAVVV